MPLYTMQKTSAFKEKQSVHCVSDMGDFINVEK